MLWGLKEDEEIYSFRHWHWYHFLFLFSWLFSSIKLMFFFAIFCIRLNKLFSHILVLIDIIMFHLFNDVTLHLFSIPIKKPLYSKMIFIWETNNPKNVLDFFTEFSIILFWFMVTDLIEWMLSLFEYDICSNVC